MNEFDARSLIAIFSELPDPHDEDAISHKLVDIVVIALCAVVGGADGWIDVEEFGLAKKAWFRSFFELPYGIPSHDTFGRVFSRIDPRAFSACFLEVVEEIRERIERARAEGEQSEHTVAIDGKLPRLRRATRDAGRKMRALGVVSAWAGATRLVLGQLAIEGKSNETTAIPAWLKTLDLKRAIVTIDAAGTQHTFSVRYFVSSREADAERMGEIIRGHWSVENGLHWILDVTFRDDQSRVRTGHTVENLALLRRLALSLITQERTLKGSVRARRNRAGWDNAYLEKVLGL